MPQPKHDILQHVGAQLRAVRESQGRTQEEVAEGAGYTGKYLSEIERGLRDLPLSTLVRLAEQGLHAGLDVRIGNAPPPRAVPVPADLQEMLDALGRLPPRARRSVRQLVLELAGAFGHD
jgi:transcriptional regulator with XRE-family HTH domain